MTILLHIAQVIFVLIAISWFRAFATGHPNRLKALYVSIGFAGGALASFLLMAWWPLAVGFGAVVIGGTMIESLGSGMGEAVGASAEQRVEEATRMLPLALQKKSSKARHKALHQTLDVVLYERKFFELEVGSDLHQRYWEIGHRTAIEILKYQDVLNIHRVWFADNYDEAKGMLGNGAQIQLLNTALGK